MDRISKRDVLETFGGAVIFALIVLTIPLLVMGLIKAVALYATYIAQPFARFIGLGA